MNEDVLSSEDQRLLDRLVDGELSETERRELLLRLENSPDGWRRCALAFLEAQAWRGEVRAVLAEREPAPTTTYAAAPANSNWKGLGIWLPLATAAGFLLAVGYVKWFDADAVGPLGGGGATLATNQNGAPATTLVGSRSAEDGRPGNLQLVVEPGPDGVRRVVEVPLVEAERMNEALFGPMTQQLPPEVVRMLEQSGNQVVRERRLMPIDLQDGRRVVVPMDQLEIRPVGNRSFQ